MEEFKGFDLSNVESIEEKPEVEYISRLGDYNPQQDNLLWFGRSRHFLNLNILLIITFLLGSYIFISFLMIDYSDIEFARGISYNWVKVILGLGMLNSILIPLGVTFISLGSRKLKSEMILTGLRLLQFYLGMLFICCVISAVLFTLLLLMFILRAFALFGFIFLILAVAYYVTFKFIMNSLNFIKGIKTIFESPIADGVKCIVPSAAKFQPYLLLILVLGMINKVLTLNNNSIASRYANQGMYQQLQSVEVISNINLILGFVILGYSIYLTEKFDFYMTLKRNQE